MELKSISGDVLFEGRYKTIRRCIEAAVKKKIDLSNIDLKNINLRHTNLDGAIMPDARFWGANLTLTNMSGGYFDGSDFRRSVCADTCMAESSFNRCDFRGAFFSRTIIRASHFDQTQFSCPSALSLPWGETYSTKGAIFWDLGLTPLPLQQRKMGSATLDGKSKLGKKVRKTPKNKPKRQKV